MADVVDVDAEHENFSDDQIEELLLRESEGDLHEWQTFALANGIHPDVVAYINNAPLPSPSEGYNASNRDTLAYAEKVSDGLTFPADFIVRKPTQEGKSND